MRPGEHLWIIGLPGEAVEARAEGLQLRDTVLIVTPGPRMLFAYLFRKVPEGTVAENVLKYGVGGLWIDGCRLVTGDDTSRHNNADNSGRTAYGEFTKRVISGGHSDGRWPTNLLLIHASGCKRNGTKRVQATSMCGRTTATLKIGASLFWGNDRGGQKQPISGHGDPDGLETVEAWDCVEGCPVQMLDGQSGDCPSGGSKIHWGTREKYVVRENYGWGMATKTQNTPSYGDGGGASRFYPQFQSLFEALDWLVRLLGPQG